MHVTLFISECVLVPWLKYACSLPSLPFFQDKGIKGLGILHTEVLFLVLSLWPCCVVSLSLSTNYFKPFKRAVSGSPGFYAFSGFFIYAWKILLCVMCNVLYWHFAVLSILMHLPSTHSNCFLSGLKDAAFHICFLPRRSVKMFAPGKSFPLP